MVFIDIALVVLVAGSVLSFWGWLAIRVVDQGRKLIELEVRISGHEKNEDEHLSWFRLMDSKLQEVRENTAACRQVCKVFENLQNINEVKEKG